jgi:hypothetical protein
VGRNDDVLSDLVQIVDQNGNWVNRGHWRHFQYWFELLFYHKKNFSDFKLFFLHLSIHNNKSANTMRNSNFPKLATSIQRLPIHNYSLFYLSIFWTSQK